mmetsp:Transcript_18753/g.52201  ORF Transcript_18753/g.52201 Transcript_18753/m.52201 type:complete len:371 (-) Transcript_18753:486-1598(-)
MARLLRLPSESIAGSVQVTGSSRVVRRQASAGKLAFRSIRTAQVFSSRSCRQVPRAESQVSTGISEEKKAALFEDLQDSCKYVKSAPAIEKVNASSEVLRSMSDLKDAGLVPAWGSAVADSMQRRNIFLGELKQMGILSPEQLAVPSVRNDAAFLITTVGVTSALALVAGVTLPGDWGFFVPYLIGGISIAVLAIGSTSPGALQFIINQFSQVFPDYRERCARHEAAHFLVGYLLGVPIAGYSLDVGLVHTDFVEAKLQDRLISKRLSEVEVDTLAVIAMAGIAAEGLKYEEVIGQSGDLFDLQKILNRSEAKLSNSEQQNLTRWAVYQALGLIKNHQHTYDRLTEAMQAGKPVSECVRIIEESEADLQQ